MSFQRGLYFLYTWLAGYNMLVLGHTSWLRWQEACALVGGPPASPVLPTLS